MSPLDEPTAITPPVDDTTTIPRYKRMFRSTKEKFATYVHRVGWPLTIALILVSAPGPLGDILDFPVLLHVYAPLVPLLTTTPLTMAPSVPLMPWLEFFLIAVPRLLVGYPVYYFIGRRLARYADPKAEEAVLADSQEEDFVPEKWRLWQAFAEWLQAKDGKIPWRLLGSFVGMIARLKWRNFVRKWHRLVAWWRNVMRRFERWLQAKDQKSPWMLAIAFGQVMLTIVPYLPGSEFFAIAGAKQVGFWKLVPVIVFAAVVRTFVVYKFGAIIQF
jgi:hypothetical protein